jgi:hypothetical protein
MEPIAVRRLTWNDGDAAHDVLVRIWQPVLGEHDFVCDFAIDGLPEPVRTHAGGIDALQALINALAGIRHYLKPYRDAFSWLDVRGWHGVPMSLHAIDEPADERSIEELVESESNRLLERRSAPKKRRIDELRARHDPEFGADISRFSTQELIERLRIAATEQREHEQAGNANAAHAFFLKRLDIFAALRGKSDYFATLEALTADDDRSIRLQAAQRLGTSARAIAALERLRDEGIEPEASEAARWLEVRRRDDARTKPWD